MSVAPTVLLMAPTMTNDLGTAVTSDEAGWVGLGMAVNNGGTTQQVSGGFSSDYGGSGGNTVEKSYIHTSKALVTRTISGAEAATATVNSWDSGGVTLNFSAVSALQAYVPYLAFGPASTATKYLKLLAHSSAQSATGVAGVVFQAPTGGAITGAEIGEFTGEAFEGTLEGGKAVLKVPVADFGGTSLTTSDTPVALVRNSTNTTGIVSCTVIEE
jgi:hypothetical protein